jgi:hypothetical protein
MRSDPNANAPAFSPIIGVSIRGVPQELSGGTMTLFRFSAVEVDTGRALPVEVFLADHSHGYTPSTPGETLEIESSIDGPQPWYAMVRNARIAKGVSDGGTFRILVDETRHIVRVEAA